VPHQPTTTVDDEAHLKAPTGRHAAAWNTLRRRIPDLHRAWARVDLAGGLQVELRRDAGPAAQRLACVRQTAAALTFPVQALDTGADYTLWLAGHVGHRQQIILIVWTRVCGCHDGPAAVAAARNNRKDNPLCRH
jgi:hypothetical protein